MFLQQTLETIQTFISRYLPFHTDNGEFTEIRTCNDMVLFTFDYDYTLYVWIENGELHIENDRSESIFDYAEEHGWNESDIEFMKFGTKTISLSR